MTEPVNQMTDGALLAAFSATGNQTAFAEIVQRHGAMVHGVCLRGLGDHHEAEDATQAVFVTLARKAASLRKDSSVGGWLHTVARRLAKDIRRSRAARQRREEMVMSDAAVTNNEGLDPRLFRESLDDALGDLPDRYRRPLVLFHLEGRSLQQTAAQLGLTASATGVRLSRARELLRQKLVRRGIGVGSVGALTALLSAESGAAVLPATIIAATVKAATGGTVSTTVAALTKGALDMLFWNSVKTTTVVTVTCVILLGTVGVVAGKLPAPTNTKSKLKPVRSAADITKQKKRLPSVSPNTPADPADEASGLPSQCAVTFRAMDSGVDLMQIGLDGLTQGWILRKAGLWISRVANRGYLVTAEGSVWEIRHDANTIEEWANWPLSIAVTEEQAKTFSWNTHFLTGTKIDMQFLQDYRVGKEPIAGVPATRYVIRHESFPSYPNAWQQIELWLADDRTILKYVRSGFSPWMRAELQRWSESMEMIDIREMDIDDDAFKLPAYLPQMKAPFGVPMNRSN